MTGEPLEAEWWELLLQQVNTEQGVTGLGTLPSATLMHVVVNTDGHADQQAMSPDQTRSEHTGASENDRQQTALKAA